MGAPYTMGAQQEKRAPMESEGAHEGLRQSDQKTFREQISRAQYQIVRTAVSEIPAVSPKGSGLERNH
jgi:hypothetical protein